MRLRIGRPGRHDLFVRGLAKAVAREMSESGWTMGCVAQTLAQELPPGDAEMAEALAALFGALVEIIAAAIGSSEPAASAQSRATALVAALEGARTLARAQRSAAPFDAVASQFSR
ncbi:hypothetical protein D9M73_104780 [compost metagenome]|jgi:TetR/AcrR family transcriptional repressor of lmrAB and yxaGH operons